MLFSIVAVLVCIPTNSVRGFPFLHTLPAFVICRLLDRSHSDWCEMVPHSGFDLHLFLLDALGENEIYICTLNATLTYLLDINICNINTYKNR